MSIISAIIVLGGIGLLSAAILYVVSKRFYVKEDPRIALVEELLPGANCGSCGRSGCHDFACACATAASLDNLVCPGAGEEAMKKIADIVGLAPNIAKPQVAVLKCYGTCENRPMTVSYDGPASCAMLHTTGSGTTSCPFGCLGCGDCVKACRFGAMYMDPVTGLPAIDPEKCTGCGACSKVCPRHIIELRDKWPRGMRVWVACSNREKGAVARKECNAACIGCGKCMKACPHDAVSVTDNLAYIDFTKCKLCRKCVLACPTSAIHDAGFPISAADMAAIAERKRKEAEAKKAKESNVEPKD